MGNEQCCKTNTKAQEGILTATYDQVRNKSQSNNTQEEKPNNPCPNVSDSIVEENLNACYQNIVDEVSSNSEIFKKDIESKLDKKSSTIQFQKPIITIQSEKIAKVKQVKDNYNLLNQLGIPNYIQILEQKLDITLHAIKNFKTYRD